MADFLLELFSEDIPARMQARACDDLKKLITDGIMDRGLTYSAAAAFATPRRLCLSLTGLPDVTPDTREERKGPRTDAPEKALEGFLRSTGLTKDQLEARDDKKGQVWFAVIKKKGAPAADVLSEVIEHAIRNFPWPRSMRWGTGDLRWVRPLQSIMAVLIHEANENEIVPVSVGDLTSGAQTFGHRFMAPDAITPADFDDYIAKLAAAKVVLDPADRRDRIWADATNMAFAQGMEVVDDKGLLAEVAGLVEWPVVLMGDIEDQFLGLPPEVLQTSMKEHQKFFSVKNPANGRIEKFITVANTETPDNGATILAGNQRVLAARLADGLFFWENDLRVAKGEGGLAVMAKPLENVTFHNKLGTQAERIARIAALAREIAPLVGADPEKAERAAKIAKADLSSEMVYEFPELQGIMGKYYAEAAGEDANVAEACETHYSPLGPSDDVPTEPVAVAVSLAEKVDILTGFWAIDEKPTGSKDPFALRRAALGVIRIVLFHQNHMKLHEVVIENYRAWLSRLEKMHALCFKSTTGSIGTYPMSLQTKEPAEEDAFWWVKLAILHGGDPLDTNSSEIFDYSLFAKYQGTEELADDLLAFFADRLKVHLRGEGVRHDVIDACFQLGGQDDLVLVVSRVKSLQSFVETEDGKNLLAGYKRATNILAAEEKKDGVEYTLDPNVKFASLPEETALFVGLDHAEHAIAPALEAEDFASAMSAMAALRAPIDAFFEKVTVNDDNDVVRRNRLCLLNRVKKVMEQVAIFSAIEG